MPLEKRRENIDFGRENEKEYGLGRELSNEKISTSTFVDWLADCAMSLTILGTPPYSRRSSDPVTNAIRISKHYRFIRKKQEPVLTTSNMANVPRNMNRPNSSKWNC